MTVYKNSFNFISSNVDQRLREGFTQFQKDANFVDMVIAADGCFKKVHRSIIALSSPYLAELINVMPSNNPVLYLYGIKHQIFTYLVQYIYNGHVEVPIESVSEFIDIIKKLQIKGLENTLNTPTQQDIKHSNQNQSEFVEPPQEQLISRDSNSHLMDIDGFQCDPGIEDLQRDAGIVDLQHDAGIVGLPREANVEVLQCDPESQSPDPNSLYANNNMIDFEEAIDSQQPQPLTLPDTSCELSNTTDILYSIPDCNVFNPSNSSESKTGTLFISQINLDAQGGFSLGKIVMDPEPGSKSYVNKPHVPEATNYSNAQGGFSLGKIVTDPEPGSKSYVKKPRAPEATNYSNAEGGFSLGKIVTDPDPGRKSYVKKHRVPEVTNYSNDDGKEDENFKPKYCISKLGRQVQMLVDGYTFYAHNTFIKKNKRRWRCTTYRRGGCKAFIDTEGDDDDFTQRITNHNQKHNHESKSYGNKKRFEMLYDTVQEATKALTHDSDSVISSLSDFAADIERTMGEMAAH